MTAPLLTLEYANPTERPPYSRIVSEDLEDGGIVFTLPPDRWWKIIFPMLVIIGLIGLMVITGIAFAMNELWPLGALLGVFAFLLGLLGTAVVVSVCRPTRLAVQNGEVVLAHGASLFRRVERWQAQSVKDVRVAVRGFSANMRLTGELMLVRSQGHSIPLLCGRDRIEMEWIARGLRRALDSSHKSQTGVAHDSGGQRRATSS